MVVDLVGVDVDVVVVGAGAGVEGTGVVAFGAVDTGAGVGLETGAGD